MPLDSNFADLLISLGAVENSKEIGREMYGRVLEVAEDVEGISIGQSVVGMGFGFVRTRNDYSRSLGVSCA